MFKTGAQMLLLVLLAGLFLLRESRQWPCSMVNEGFCDWISLNGPGLPHPDPAPVTLVAIDDSSVSDHPWPWSPLDFSLFAQASQTFHPEVTAFDEMLNWDGNPAAQGERQRQFEIILRDTLLRCPKVLLASRLGWPEDPQVVPPLQEVPLIHKINGDLRAIPEWTSIERQPKEEYRLPSTLGFINLPQQTQPRHSIPLLLRYRGEVVPSFVLQAVVLWKKLSLDDVTVELGSHVAVGSDLKIPIDDAGEMRVDFGAPRTLIGFDELLLATEQAAAKQKTAATVDRMKGGIALLGRTDAPSRTLTLGPGKKGSEAEFFTAAIATIQSQLFVHRVPAWFDVAIIALACLVSFWVPGRKKLTVATGAAIALIAYGLCAIAWFASARVWIPVVLPVGLILFIAAYRFATPDPVSAAPIPPVEEPVPNAETEPAEALKIKPRQPKPPAPPQPADPLD